MSSEKLKIPCVWEPSGGRTRIQATTEISQHGILLKCRNIHRVPQVCSILCGKENEHNLHTRKLGHPFSSCPYSKIRNPFGPKLGILRVRPYTEGPRGIRALHRKERNAYSDALGLCCTVRSGSGRADYLVFFPFLRAGRAISSSL